ncbi:MAG: hypothetical protein QM765_28550 [Myxococcales bacterium]
MTRSSAATLLVLWLALLAQLGAAACHAPLELASCESTSADSQVEHQEQVVQEPVVLVESLPMGRWQGDECPPPVSPAAGEILHVPKA